MIKFFKQIRQNQIMENKTGKPAFSVGRYFKYAIGEIILVVIGILIALQVSNWNQRRVEQNTINAYYVKLISTLENDIKEEKKNIEDLNSYAADLTRCLEIIDNKNEEDIDELKFKIGTLTIAFVNDYSMELFDEFINKGYLSKIEDIELKAQFESVKVFLIQGRNWDALLDDSFVSNGDPFVQNNLNYTDIRLSGNLFSEEERPKGGPKVDYTKLFNNLKAWNVIYGRLINIKNTTIGKNRMLEALKKLKIALEAKTSI